jgi:2-iminobutanoate/2-iminopropanoate deaminase
MVAAHPGSRHQAGMTTGARTRLTQSIGRIVPRDRWSSTVPVTPAVCFGGLLHVSGTPGFDDDGHVAVGDFTRQMTQAMVNVAAALGAVGSTWNDALKVMVFLTRPEDVGEMNTIYRTFFDRARFPARTTAIVVALPHADLLVEIECLARVPAPPAAAGRARGVNRTRTA